MTTHADEESATSGEGERAGVRARKRRGPNPMALVLVLLVALVAVVVLSARARPGTVAAPAPAPVHVPQVIALHPVPIGQTFPGCLDPHSSVDRLAVCPSDLTGSWVYDGGVTQTDGGSAPSCVASVKGALLSWVDLDNAAVHLRETVFRAASAADAQAEVAAAQTQTEATLCANLTGADPQVSATAVSLPAGASAVATRSFVTGRRVWTVAYVSVDRAVLQVVLNPMAATPAPVSRDIIADVLAGSIQRYVAATTPTPSVPPSVPASTPASTPQSPAAS